MGYRLPILHPLDAIRHLSFDLKDVESSVPSAPLALSLSGPPQLSKAGAAPDYGSRKNYMLKGKKVYTLGQSGDDPIPHACMHRDRNVWQIGIGI